jgi:predicted ArsR family transcriptional regulator
MDESDLPNFGEKEALMLRAIAANDGEADTVALKDMTGLNAQQIAYRYDKLEGYGLVDTGYRLDEDTPGRPTRYARLTERGRRVVESGRLERISDARADTEVAVDELRSEVSQLKRRVGETESGLKRVTERLNEVAEKAEYGKRIYELLVEEYSTEFVEERLYPNDGVKCSECGASTEEVPAVCPGCGRIVVGRTE